METPLTACRLVAVAIVGCCLLVVSAVSGQEAEQVGSKEEAQTETRIELKPDCTDAFQSDSRGQYTLSGDVTWAKGELRLETGSSVRRALDGGPWTRLEFGVKCPDPSTDSPQTEFRIWLELDEATPCCVGLRQELQADKVLSYVLAIDTIEREDQLVEQVIRGAMVDAIPIRVAVEYRAGLLTIQLGEERALSAYLENGIANVTAVRCESLGDATIISQLSAMSYGPASFAVSEADDQKMNELDQQFDSLMKARQFAEAIKIGRQRLGLFRKIVGADHPIYTSKVEGLASRFRECGLYAEAEGLYVEACERSKAFFGAGHPYYATGLNNLGTTYESQGKFALAEQLFQESSDIWKDALGEGHPYYAISLANLARLYESQDKFAQAEPLCIQAAKIWKEAAGTDHRGYGASLATLGLLYATQGKYASAEPLFFEAQQVLERSLGAEHPDYARNLLNVATLNQDIGDYARAEELFLQAQEIFRNALGPEHSDYAKSLSNLAVLYTHTGEYPLAEALYMQAGDIYTKAFGTEHPSYALILNNVAGLKRNLGELPRAEALFREGREIIKKVHGTEHRDYAWSLVNLASLYEEMGQADKARSMFLEAHEIRKRIFGTDHPDYARSLSTIAGLHFSAGEIVEAKSCYEEVCRILKDSSGAQHPQYASSLVNLAGFLTEIGEYEEAETLCLESRDIRLRVLGAEHPDYAASLHQLAATREFRDQHVLATPLFREAHDVLVAAAAKSLPTLSEAEAASWLTENRPRTDLVLSNLRKVGGAQATKAYEAVWNAKSISRRLRRAGTSPGDIAPDAKKVAAQLRDARLKLAKLVSAKPGPNQSAEYREAVVKANDEKELLEKQLAKLSESTERALAIRDAKADDLLAALPPGVAIVDFIQLNDWEYEEIERVIPQGDGAVEIRIVRETKAVPVYDAFVLRSDLPEGKQIAWVQLGPADVIEEAVGQWRAELTGGSDDRGLGTKSERVTGTGKPSEGSRDDAGRKLQQLVWQKLARHLQDCHTVVVLPDGVLHRVPWAALPGRDAGSFLIEDYAVATASYGQELWGLLTDEPVMGAEQLLVVGGIEYDDRSDTEAGLLASRGPDRSADDRRWSYLPGAEQEAAAVADSWRKPSKVARLSGVEADEKSVADLLAQSRYAHLATHGFFDTEANVYQLDLRKQSLFDSGFGAERQATVAARNPLLMTGIVLAGANVGPQRNDLGIPISDDGILTAEEIVGLDLRQTELVTLSACETGLGDVAVGEGVMGLQRALHQAGARSVVASLWKVSDRATRALMTEFYRNMWERKMGKLDALRQAQLTMLQHYDPQNGLLRGLGKKSQSIEFDPSPEAPAPRPKPKYWAAFQLSGDWR